MRAFFRWYWVCALVAIAFTIPKDATLQHVSQAILLAAAGVAIAIHMRGPKP